MTKLEAADEAARRFGYSEESMKLHHERCKVMGAFPSDANDQLEPGTEEQTVQNFLWQLKDSLETVIASGGKLPERTVEFLKEKHSKN